jgi:hypothetical protein
MMATPELDDLFGALFAPVQLTLQQRASRWLMRKAARLVRRVMRKMWGAGRILAPWYIAMVVWIASAMAGLSEQGWRMLAGIGIAGAIPMYWWLGGPLGYRSRRRKLKPAEQRIWFAAFYAVLAVWAPVAAAWTVLPPWIGVLWVSTFAAWVRWLWHHRARPKEQPVETGTPRDLTWSTVKGMNGTRLDNVVELHSPKRWEADVDLADTDMLVKDVAAATAHIAKRFKVPVSNVIADYAGSRLEDVARLTVVQDNPCFDPVVYDDSWIPTEQDIAAGVVPFHLYPNGMRAKVRLWLPGAGTVNSLFSGDIRTGKSAGMEAKMLQACFTGKVWPMAADPQGGVSIPTWCAPEGRGHARWQATDLDGIFRQAEAFRDGMYARSLFMAHFRWTDRWGDEQIGINCWDPSIPGMPPAVGWAIDEVWALMKIPEFAAIFKECMKMQNKTGMYMDMSTQYPGIEEFNNDMAMRQPLTAGNLLAYRNTASSVKEMILPAGLPSPMQIPWETPDGEHTKGTLVAASQAPRSSLPVYSRSVWVERGRYWAAQASERIPELDEATAAAFAPYMKPAAEPLPDAEPERESVTVRAAAPAERRPRAEDRIAEFLCSRDDRRAHTGVIASELDMPKGTVGTTLKRMEARGLVSQPRAGIWQISSVLAESAA